MLTWRDDYKHQKRSHHKCLAERCSVRIHVTARNSTKRDFKASGLFFNKHRGRDSLG